MLGEPGWRLLELLREHQLSVATSIVCVYLLFRLWRWANGAFPRKGNP